MEREDIAITGIGCRFPQANSPDEFWRMLAEGREAIGPIPASRRDLPGIPVQPALTGGFFDDVGEFDPGYFGIPASEAAHIDPQQRLMLEVASSAIEDSYTPPSQLSGPRTGVFVGISTHDYAVLIWNSASPNPAAAAGTSNSMAANRISYWLNAGGPSLTVDTACSSALTALHYACQSIEAGAIDCAIVGGVSVLLLPAVTEAFVRAGVISRRGSCRAFDRSADGYVRSEGAAAVVLKRMSRARGDGDRIYALVKGTAINHNGFSNGLTAPNPAAEVSLLKGTWQNAGVLPADVDFVEAMGSSTLLGDAIELRSIAAVMGEGRDREHPCYVGSVKTNVGHMEAASGMAALIKTALALWQREIPGNLHLSSPNEALTANSSLRVNRDTIPWPRRSKPAFAGVNSFGFGGANAHVALSEAPEPEDRTPGSALSSYVLALSARSEPSLRNLVDDYIRFLRETPEECRDICYTASVGRAHHAHRLAVCGASNRELGDKLAEERGRERVARNRAPRLAFLFSSNPDSTHSAPVNELPVRFPAFQQALEACRNAASGMEPAGIGWDFALKYSIGVLLRDLGLRPTVLLFDGNAARCAALATAGSVHLSTASDLVQLVERMPETDFEEALARVAPRPGEIPLLGVYEAQERRPGIAYAVEVALNGRLIEVREGLIPPSSGLDVGSNPSWPASLWAACYSVGIQLQWERVFAGMGARKVAVPRYPHSKQPYWFSPGVQTIQETRQRSGGTALMEEIERELESLGY